jgi:hypothetical protein
MSFWFCFKFCIAFFLFIASIRQSILSFDNNDFLKSLLKDFCSLLFGAVFLFQFLPLLKQLIQYLKY